MKLTNVKLERNNKKMEKISRRIQRILKILWKNKILILQNCQNDKKMKRNKIQWQI